MDNLNYIGQTGWVCPKCGRVFSPNTPMCSFCAPNKPTITSTNTSTSFGQIDNEGRLNYPPGVRVINPTNKK